MELMGYGCVTRLVDGVLTVEATNAVSRGALGASTRSIPVAEIQAVAITAPSMLSNGRLTVQSAAGVTVIHYLRKSDPAARELHQALLKLSNAPAAVRPQGKLANETVDGWAEWARASASAARERQGTLREKRRQDYIAWREQRASQRERHGTDAEDTAARRADLLARRAQNNWSLTDVATVTHLLDAAEAQNVDDVEPAPRPEQTNKTVDEVVNELLHLAVIASGAGDISLEERYIADAVEHAKVAGKRSDRKSTAAEIERRVAESRLRVGSALLGVVKAESGLAQWGRTQSILAVSLGGERQIEVRSDRIIAGRTVRTVDEFTSAQVYLDGQTQVLMRPTLTRMALLSPLPGSALIPGLALQKKTTHDTRTAEFQIGSVGWNLRVSIPPTAANDARAVAEQINRLAGYLEKTSAASAPTSLESGVDIALSQLERLTYLHERGMISAEEAKRLRESILQ